MSSSAQIAGNAPDAVKERVINAHNLISRANIHFGKEIRDDLVLKEVNIRPKADESQRMEARVVLEITVVESMLNVSGNVHGGCTAYLVDM
ncbi:hypothetical protein EWM64_g4786 [Hericium alpestre]|uniref:Thioesterase domain-containing protein n=1 Tax=Hericium alpestre TaxID=135208 RepID=A0A4Y9ZYV3_9AGAM|nr:hypothetical protein EWM64_g4786 [Hericium alpestre]